MANQEWEVVPNLICPVDLETVVTKIVADPAPKTVPCGHLVGISMNDDEVVYYLDRAE